ncbi:tudor domain-containing protein 7A [Pleuronectes platessa]|uniref:tudor domain-containing protein 7A n=1 Tax=Pleuronectes platessa TaxID=8262 RepID=UPI00232A3702|nr:tudor domain-containing protein 7A [Pleuronectes platessa]
MSDSEAIHKILRSVLQSSNRGVSINSLQSEYRSLCGQNIPLKKLGFSELEHFLRSIPSVVKLEYGMGELKCYAAACRETAHIAELVARQKSSKKSGRSQVVNCKMRFKPSNPLMFNLKPRSSLRQPSASGASNWTSSRSRTCGGFRGFSAAGDYRQLDQKLSYSTPVEHRQPAPQPAVRQCVRKENSFANCQQPKEKPLERASRPNLSKSSLCDVGLMQSRITLLLKKYRSGLWMSKISELYSKMFSESLHPQVLKDLEKWTHICMLEQTSCNNRADRLVYPPLLPKLSVVPRIVANNTPLTSPTNSEASSTQNSPRPSKPEEPTPRSRSPLAQPTFIFPPQSAAASSGKQLSSVTLRSPLHNPALAPQIPPRASRAAKECKDNHNISTATRKKNTPRGPDILPLSKLTFSSTSDSVPFSTTSAVTVSAEVRQRIKELLTKYSHGLWANALPKLFIETYKTPFPENVLDHLPLLLDMCSVEYPIPHDKNRAILYLSDSTDMEATDGQAKQHCRCPFPSGLEVPSPKITPGLPRPSEQFPSVLVTDAKSNAVTIRYVGENYSNAQEAMEDAMCSFYSQGSTHHPLSNPRVGQLIAVRGEGGDELARAQVIEVMAPNKVKVYYVDYGFSVEMSGSNLLELHQDFLSLPFQATNVKLAGLETLSAHPLVQSSLDKLVVGKILLMETLEPCQQIELPLVVLYDTSQDDDININSTCLKSLRDNTMNNPLTLNVTQQDVCVTKVSPDGIIYCQLPSRGTAKLNKLLEKNEAFFIFQMTSESLVSRPFSGKFCLASYKGKWSRVEITNMYNNRVLEILFIDLGIPATVEVTALREIPPPLLKEFITIPPQAIRCRLADLKVPEGEWSPQAVQWMEEAVMSSKDCKMKITKLDEHKGALLVYMYLFIGVDSQDLHKSINHELAQSEQWQKLITQNNYTFTSSTYSMDTGLDALVQKLTLNSPVPSPFVKTSNQPCYEADSSLTNGTTKNVKQPLPLPPLLELPQPGQNMDVFVPVACHPRYFVLQPWQDLHKLTVLMGEMIFYYNQHKTTTPTHIQSGEFFAARIDKNWHRVQVKGILANGLVSVYELDYGKHEHVHSNLIRPLIEEFRQLPFQAVTAQLAGVINNQWSEEASILFRNHVEKKALVAQVVSVHEGSEVKGRLREPRLTVYLVDTTLEERDLWIHTLMVDMDVELSSAA